jgi:hypothetical protein
LGSDSTDENSSYTGVKHAGSDKSLASWQPFPPARRKAGFFLLLTIDIVYGEKVVREKLLRDNQLSPRMRQSNQAGRNGLA